MRLRKIKLVGFKSFVDPTTFIVPDNLVGVVGPNGCGKSNIIDAVTWVMGESSAKHLRGDALTDVIFNGSSARQPVGQASVELIFDNSDGKIGGQYASYAEISIKRQINREAISTYFLNGTKCRRKDIQGIFLGTGLGPRSYAIIEQGMISRLIEAKPEELRTFIEEAAGISKFRERRRETENRIRHTRENISRLTDIREEVEKQLNHLHRQAKAAERYQVLKQEERQLQAELLALNWQKLTDSVRRRAEIVRQHENRVEEGMAQLRAIETGIEQQRQEYAAANEGFNSKQSAFYEVGSEISNIEQRLEHIDERVASLTTDLDSSRIAEQDLVRNRDQDQRELEAAVAKARQLEPRLQGSRSESNDAYNTLTGAEEAMQAWQSEWDSLNETISEYNRQYEVTSTRLEHLQDSLEEARQRRLNLVRESEEQDLGELESQLQQLSRDHSEIESGVLEQRKQQVAAQEELKQLRGQLILINSQMSELRDELQSNEGKIAALQARQLGEALDHKDAINTWMKKNNISDDNRVIDNVDVKSGWSLAFETVAGHFLQDICVDNTARLNQAAAELGSGRIGLVSAQAKPGHYKVKPLPRLLDRIKSRINLDHFLDRVYIAETLKEAEKILENLDSSESVVTRDGVWMSKNWTRINRPATDDEGMLSREQKLRDLQEVQKNLLTETRELEKKVTENSEQIDRKEQEIVAVLDQQTRQQDSAASAQARHAEFSARHEQARNRLKQIDEELSELDMQEQNDSEELESLRDRLAQVDSDREKLLSQREQLARLRDSHKTSLDQARSTWQNTHQHSHEIALQLESYSSQKASMEQAIKRSDIQIAGTRNRIKELQESMEKQKLPVADLKQSLEARLADKIKAEAHLADARQNVQTQEQELRKREQSRTEAEEKIQEMRNALESARIESQEIKVRLQTVEEHLQSIQRDPADLLEELEEGATEAAWKEKLESVERKIQRLGAINLAAIDEYDQLSERKGYLDSQSADLNEALDTLETAIRKIDRETRTRFKETFDKLNTNLKESFPVLFGGGHAYLEMTGQDLLETGVTVMARPPGKKISTIHLLSGGEKALTAVALVFSIFKLNPAPFCILDEVDAPLDDTNVGRFSEMVQQMSTEIQFIVITHNKITMEIAQQLLGVTMQEPGVSRLVSVDMEEAVEMAASA